ncbi:hypothetical protein EGT07_01390 [Herbaspirillum sp. HC18]|nr:hypothetical protein EGT07_01390 [Herbaspirillum sp. HC18]
MLLFLQAVDAMHAFSAGSKRRIPNWQWLLAIHHGLALLEITFPYRNKCSFRLVYRQCKVLHVFVIRVDAMKWFYEWRLSKVRAEISALEEATRVRLQDDYTSHSRLRVLNRVASSLQQRLNKYHPANAAGGKAEGAH